MEDLAQRFHFYCKSHSHPINKILHYIGVPAVLLSLMIFCSWIHISMSPIFDLHGSWFLMLGLLVYYYKIDAILTGVTAIVLFPLVLFVNLLSHFSISYYIFAIFFTMGWILQMFGHFIENKRPAFFADPSLLLFAPLFLIAEIAIARGYRKDLVHESRLPEESDTFTLS